MKSSDAANGDGVSVSAVTTRIEPRAIADSVSTSAGMSKTSRRHSR